LCGGCGEFGLLLLFGFVDVLKRGLGRVQKPGLKGGIVGKGVLHMQCWVVRRGGADIGIFAALGFCVVVYIYGLLIDVVSWNAFSNETEF